MALACGLCMGIMVQAQTIYVDPAAGNDGFSGSKQQPVQTIARAAALTRTFKGREPICIKLLPGLHLLARQVVIDSLPVANDTALLSIEAAVLPGDTAWRPWLMPVIQSVSDNNKDYGNFNHCIGLQVERGKVAIRGLKFTGNAHPGVKYYYPVERHKPYLQGLYISNCLFVGSPNIAPLQGAVFAQGRDIAVDHCTFYNCKNAILCFVNTSGFVLTHSVIYGAYEAAVRLGYGADGDLPFVFKNNVIANSEYAWLGYKTTHHYYIFEDAVFTGNHHFIGYNVDPPGDDTDNKVTEHRVAHVGTILFDDNFMLLPVSAGYDLTAGYEKK